MGPEHMLASAKALPVAHVWFGDYLALYLELGILGPGRPRKHGLTVGNPVGQLTLYAGYDWRIGGPRSIVAGVKSARSRAEAAAKSLVGCHIKSVEVLPKLLELRVEFEGGRSLTTLSLSEGQPQWTLGTQKAHAHACIKKWRLASAP